MKPICLDRPPSRLSSSDAANMGGAGSIAEAMAGKHKPTGLSRYTKKGTKLCTACKRGRHYSCTSLKCPCPQCNPEIL